MFSAGFAKLAKAATETGKGFGEATYAAGRGVVVKHPDPLGNDKVSPRQVVRQSVNDAPPGHASIVGSVNNSLEKSKIPLADGQAYALKAAIERNGSRPGLDGFAAMRREEAKIFGGAARTSFVSGNYREAGHAGAGAFLNGSAGAAAGGAVSTGKALGRGDWFSA